MRLYEVVSLLLCSWKAEVYINKIYNSGALKGLTTIWKNGTPIPEHKAICIVVLYYLG